jgi:hypothetical protein
MFGTPLSPESSEYLTRYYIEMNRRFKSRSAKNAARKGGAKKTLKASRKESRSRSRSRSSRSRSSRSRSRKASRRAYGGALTGAPLQYAMTPGANVGVYGRFPTEIGNNASLDVFYKSALNTGCGTENSTRTVPETMGDNKVGGRRRRKTARSTRKRGGNFLGSLEGTVSSAISSVETARPFLASAPPNIIQSTYEKIVGNPTQIPADPSPVTATWKYTSAGIDGMIPPSDITTIQNDITKLAYPAPWQTTFAPNRG